MEFHVFDVGDAETRFVCTPHMKDELAPRGARLVQRIRARQVPPAKAEFKRPRFKRPGYISPKECFYGCTKKSPNGRMYQCVEILEET